MTFDLQCNVTRGDYLKLFFDLNSKCENGPFVDITCKEDGHRATVSVTPEELVAFLQSVKGALERRNYDI